ncbi:MAG: glycosyltransferase [Bacillaceae bacterium]|nr:glycosyltransferase [Bacillaceae bacterium]
MAKKLKGLISDFIHWFVENILNTRQRSFVKNIFSDKQKDFIKKLLKNGKKIKQIKSVDNIKYKLNSLGFTKRAYIDLLELSKDSDVFLKQLASWELAVYHSNRYTKEDAKKCIEFLEQALQGVKDSNKIRQGLILKAESLDILGEAKQAKSVILQELEKNPHPDLFLAYSNLETTVDKKLDFINRMFNEFSVAKISFELRKDKLFYDSLISKEYEKIRCESKPKVTVIVPVYNAEDVITTSIKSILNQSWSNLEIIVVDDCSTDNTVKIVKDISLTDNRVILLSTGVNSGAYVARNYALKIATGEFVTINDADDWSHPQKIEKQATHLLNNHKYIGNMSQQVRATNELKFFRRGKPGLYIFANMSSFMFRREPVINSIGYWDSVRFGADSEFIKRIKRKYGKNCVIELNTGPLSFQRQSNNSLTGNSAFGFPGYFMGARKEYLEAQEAFHEKGNLYYNFPQIVRPFAVPKPMLPNRGDKSLRRHYDIVIVSDFRLDGGSTMSNIEEIKAHKLIGKRTGIIQMNRYDYTPKKKIHPLLRDLLDGDNVEMIVYGENVSCDLLILRYPPILQEWQKYIPSVEAEEIVVIINQTPLSHYGQGCEIRYEIKKCMDNLEKYFGKKGIWYPIGPLVRNALLTHHENDVNLMNLSTKNWTNIIDIRDWERKELNKTSIIPRIGRHSRGQYLKWPSDKDELLAIYPDSDDVEVHILGGAEIPKTTLGYIPQNWFVLEFGKTTPKEFLEKLDVFVYYTHPECVESFGRVIIEAMAVGVPVIIPYKFEELFGDAAIYANPFEVQQKVKVLINDADLYETQVNKAKNYVNEHFSVKAHLNRIDKFLK